MDESSPLDCDVAKLSPMFEDLDILATKNGENHLGWFSDDLNKVAQKLLSAHVGAMKEGGVDMDRAHLLTRLLHSAIACFPFQHTYAALQVDVASMLENRAMASKVDHLTSILEADSPLIDDEGALRASLATLKKRVRSVQNFGIV